MVVSITWSETSRGAASSAPLDWGNIGNGENSTDDLYIRHDGSEKIYDCVFYIQAYTGSYTGGASAAADYSELIGWGDGDDTEGFLINQTHLTASPGTYVTHKTGQGTAAAPITLLDDIIIDGPGAADGEIASGEEGHIKVKIAVPSGENVAGTRQFDQVLKYTYTS